MNIQERHRTEPDFVVNPDEGALYEPRSTEDVYNPKASLSKKQVSLVTLIISGNFLISVCFTVLAAFFPQTALQKGATETETGFIFSVFALSTMLCSPFMGMLMPYTGARYMFLSSVFLVGGTSLLFAFVVDAPSGVPFVAISMAIRILSGIGYIAYKVATFSTLASQFPGKVATLMGINAAAFGVGVSIGPFIGGSFYDIGGFKLPFYVVSSLLLITFIIMFFVLPELKNNDDPNLEVTAVPTRWSPFDIYMIPLVYLPFFSILAIEADTAFLDLAIAQHVTSEFGVSATVAGSLFLGFQVVYAVMCPIIGIIVDKKHCEKEAMAAGLLIQIFAYLLLGPAPFFNIKGSIWLTELSLMVNGVGQAAGFIPGYKYIHSIAVSRGFPDTLKTKSKISGLVLFGMGTGQFVGPSIGGILIQHFGYGWACTGMAALNALSFLLLFGNMLTKKCVKLASSSEEMKKLLE
ncbi:Uncharacterised protein g6467 [Pycnogonum litorale]